MELSYIKKLNKSHLNFLAPDLNTVSLATLGTIHLTVQPLYNLQDAMLRYWSPSASHPTLPREAEDFPRGGKYPKDVPLPTFLAYVQLV